jgi:hypothetical protein
LVELTEHAEQGSSKIEAVAISVQALPDASDHSANNDYVIATSVDPREDVKNAATSADTLIGDVATLEGKANESNDIMVDDKALATKGKSLKDTKPASFGELSKHAEQGISETEAVAVSVQASQDGSDYSANTDNVVAPTVDAIDASAVVQNAAVADALTGDVATLKGKPK